MTKHSQLQRLVDRVTKSAIKRVNHIQDEILRSLFCETSSGKSFAIVAPIPDDNALTIQTAELKIMFAETGIIRCVICAESWMAPVDSAVRPSASERRAEVCMISGLDKVTDERIAYFFPIERDSKNKRKAGRLIGPMDIRGSVLDQLLGVSD